MSDSDELKLLLLSYPKAPDPGAHRQVLADWLEEHGDAALAEEIRKVKVQECPSRLPRFVETRVCRDAGIQSQPASDRRLAHITDVRQVTFTFLPEFRPLVACFCDARGLGPVESVPFRNVELRRYAYRWTSEDRVLRSREGEIAAMKRHDWPSLHDLQAFWLRQCPGRCAAVYWHWEQWADIAKHEADGVFRRIIAARLGARLASAPPRP